MPTVPKQQQKPTLRDIETAALLMRGKANAYNEVARMTSRQQIAALTTGDHDAGRAFRQTYHRYSHKALIAHAAMCRLSLTYLHRARAMNSKTSLAKFEALWARLDWTPAGKAAE